MALIKKHARVEQHNLSNTSKLFKDLNTVYVVLPWSTSGVEDMLLAIDPEDEESRMIGSCSLGNDDVAILGTGKTLQKLHTDKPVNCSVWITPNGYISTVIQDIEDYGIYSGDDFDKHSDYFEEVYSGKLKF